LQSKGHLNLVATATGENTIGKIVVDRRTRRSTG
jgi:hypothetical protein